MQLVSFRVRKFRNIVDSGEIAVDPVVTCFVGKNEAGKSGLLEALYLLNPAYDDEFDENEHYPRWLVVRDRKSGALSDQQPIDATFRLDDDDLRAVDSVLGAGVLPSREITVAKSYENQLFWDFEVAEAVVLGAAISALGMDGEHPSFRKLQSIEDALELAAAAPDDDGPSAEQRAGLHKALSSLGLSKEVDVWHRVVALLKPRLPKFFRFTQYSGLPGRIDLRELGSDKSDGPGKSGLQAARALLELAGTDVKQLSNDDYELRKGELEAVQIDLTSQVFEYWKQNPDLEVLIDIDKQTVPTHGGHQAVARFLDIRLRDRRTGYSNNFSQRSAGFQWFFSFLSAFSEFETQDAPIVLLDEPALTLHGKAQADFLRFINERLAPNSPVLYTTHSPFMVEAGRLERVRIVEDKGPPIGAVCSADVLGSDEDSLFPLQAALGYDIAQSLFVGPNNLVVEGTSDFIYLSALSAACVAAGLEGLDPAWRVLPAGGATNIPTFVSLVGPHLDITVLADSDTQGMQRVTNMISQGLLSGHRLILANVATESRDADLEDLFSDGDYLKLYNKALGSSIKVSELPPGNRIVKRIEANAGKFTHGVVAEYLLRHQSSVTFTEKTLAQFSMLFTKINRTLSS